MASEDPSSEPGVSEAWRTNAGARLFNLITSDWENTQVPGLFRARVRLTKKIIALLLEEGWRPKDETERVRPRGATDG